MSHSHAPHKGPNHDNDHDHDHCDHGHHHGGLGHVHMPASFGKAFAIGIVLNAVFVLIEAGYGLYSHSMALLADAGHNLSDVLGLVIAWAAVMLGKRQPTGKFTYGLGSSSILAALFNAVFLLVAVGMIAWEAMIRLTDPQPVAGGVVMGVAAVGIGINGITAWLFARGHKSDLNIKGAYLHMLADAAVSLGVVLAGAAMMFTGWVWIDPVISLGIAGLIIWGTWGLFRDSLQMSLAAVPGNIDLAQVRQFLQQLPGVQQVHDLHVWSISTTQTAMTCHLVMETAGGDGFLHQVIAQLKQDFDIDHATIQIEQSMDGFCSDCDLHP